MPLPPGVAVAVTGACKLKKKSSWLGDQEPYERKTLSELRILDVSLQHRLPALFCLLVLLVLERL